MTQTPYLTQSSPGEVARRSWNEDVSPPHPMGQPLVFLDGCREKKYLSLRNTRSAKNKPSDRVVDTKFYVWALMNAKLMWMAD